MDQNHPICYRTVFYLYFYSFLFTIVQHKFSPTYFSWGVEHSWTYYIYSMSMRYNGLEPCVISKLISGLTFQPSPILLDNLLEDSSSRRQYSKNFILNTKFYENIIPPVPPNNIIPLGTPYTSHNSYPCTTAVVKSGHEL